MRWHWTIVGVLLLISAPVVAGIAETIERIKPSIVAIGSYQKTRSPPFVFRGTGFVVGDGNLIATNAHVLPESLNASAGESLVVLSFPERGQAMQRESKTVAVDPEHDVALIRVGGPPLPAMVVNDSDAVREGDTFAFTGFPVGQLLGFSAVTHRGMVSSVTPIALPTLSARQLDAKMIRSLRTGPFMVFQLDATAYPGNSGSLLYEIETGRVVGIINMVFVRGTRETALTQPSGISFAVPIRFLRELLASPR